MQLTVPEGQNQSPTQLTEAQAPIIAGTNNPVAETAPQPSYPPEALTAIPTKEPFTITGKAQPINLTEKANMQQYVGIQKTEAQPTDQDETISNPAPAPSETVTADQPNSGTEAPSIPPPSPEPTVQPAPDVVAGLSPAASGEAQPTQIHEPKTAQELEDLEKFNTGSADLTSNSGKPLNQAASTQPPNTTQPPQTESVPQAEPVQGMEKMGNFDVMKLTIRKIFKDKSLQEMASAINEHITKGGPNGGPVEEHEKDFWSEAFEDELRDRLKLENIPV